MKCKELYGIALLDMLAFGLLMPSLEPHLLQMGSSSFMVGVITSCFKLCQLVTNPIAGNLSDVKGRKPILTKALALNMLSNVCLVFLSSSIIGIYICRILHGISNQCIVLIKTLIVDLVPPNEQTAVLSKMLALRAIGFIGGPLISGTILDSKNGFAHLTVVLTALSTASLLMGLLLPDTKPIRRKNYPEQTKNFSVLYSGYLGLMQTISNITSIDWNSFGDIFKIKFLANLSFEILQSTFGLASREKFKLAHKEMGYILAAYGIVSLISHIIAAPVTNGLFANDTNGKRRLLIVFTMNSAGYTGLAFANNISVYLMSLALIGLGRTLLETTTTEQLVKRTQKDDKGTIMGTFESLSSLPGLVVPIMCGIVIDVWGGTAPILISALLAFVTLYVVSTLKGVTKQNKDN